jgi:two-component system OmpR family sensor kinase
VKTIRARLTAWYTVALALALFAFGAALYVELQKPSELELDDRLALESSLAVRWLEDSHQVLGRLVRRDSVPPLVVPDSTGLADIGMTSTLNPAIASYFEAFRDYMVIVDRRGRILFLSESARELGFSSIELLADQIPPALRAVPPTTLPLQSPGGGVRFVVTPIEGAGEDIGAVLVAAPMVRASFDPRVLIRAMLVISPIVLGCAVALAYWLAGTALSPVRGIMDEVDAIKDGRSLHRRVAVPMSGDEMARLALTLNGMLARLEESFSSLHRFTADASHELKTPLMVLRAGVERALTHPGTPAESIEALDETLEQINQMTEMVENLLTLARADEGRAPLTVEATDLRELVADAAETAGLLAEAGGVTVESSAPPDPVLLSVDSHRIRELLLNLVTNAVKYTAAGGTVGIELEETEAAAILRVRDSGIGVAPGDLPHIFERFWRADPARSRTGDRPGVGLGLAITKWIAEAHGGSITVASRPGRGTIFTVLLPKRAGAELPELPPSRVTPEPVE